MVRLVLFIAKRDDENMMELIKIVPKRLSIGLFLIFFFAVLAFTVMLPPAAFPIGALTWLCFIQYATNFPAMSHSEIQFYGENPQRFFGTKVKLTFLLWAVGIILMVVIFVVGVNVEYADPEATIPRIDAVSSLVWLMIWLVPFIPATLFLTKVTYQHSVRTTGLATIAIVVIMWGAVIELVYIGWTKYYDYAPNIPHFDAFPFVPLSICILAASLFVSFLLSKSANKSFTEYINGRTKHILPDNMGLAPKQ